MFSECLSVTPYLFGQVIVGKIRLQKQECGCITQSNSRLWLSTTPAGLLPPVM
jgi:hypothetical protein